MRVLITGVDGYIGSILAPTLMARGHDVTGLDTGFFREAWLYNATRPTPPILTDDVRRLAPEDLAGFDAVVHLAELSNDPIGELDPDLTMRVNHAGSVALARSCKKAGVERFVYSSSCSVYGIGGGDIKTEESEVNPQTTYAKCKVTVERDVSALAGDSFCPVFLRNATAYGPSPRMRFDLVLNNLAGLAWTDRKIALTSDGTPWRPLVHVADISRAMACALEAPRETVRNQVFNVGETAGNYQVIEIARIVAEAFPGCVITVGAADLDNRSYRVSFDKAAESLPGFTCSHSAASGARELRELFGRIDMSADTFRFRPYTRLKQLQHLMTTQQVDHDLYWRH